MQLNIIWEIGLIFSITLILGFVWKEILDKCADKYQEWKFQRALRNTGISFAELEESMKH